MNVLLFRHAQKGVIPFDDPHLTPGGFAQAEAIAKAVQKNMIPKPTDIWVSEKIRTTQTMQDVARDHQIKPLQKTELNLRADKETQQMFRDRVHDLIQQLDATSEKSSTKTIYLCTHYDWVEEAMSLITSDKDLNTYEFAHWGPAQFVQFKVEDGLWKFVKKGTCT